MIELLLILHTIANMTDADAFTYVDAMVEKQTQYKFFYYPQVREVFLNTSIGDCTDKALLKCYILKKKKINCQTVHGYIDGQKHDFIKAKINNSWVKSENTTIVGVGVW